MGDRPCVVWWPGPLQGLVQGCAENAVPRRHLSCLSCPLPPTPTPLPPPAGDDEEIERFWKELGLVEKGKVLVKGILEG